MLEARMLNYAVSVEMLRDALDDLKQASWS
jgi:hypothetical protein